jgi:tRNA 5-methylaminomethyl-2-thiouridine biosynthesis bifunctional protein
MNQTTLDWQDGLPFSAQYGDVYFSRDSGIDETRHVFLQQNHLRERWQALKPGEHFVIGETGFGTGLNFLCAWQLWDEVAPRDARLHFVSTELHPIPPDELQQALALWPELAEFSAGLLSQYNAMATGWHRLTLAEGRIVLTLLIGDVLSTLPRLDALVDAWFLDGFAPSKNPQMWNDQLFQAMAQHSAPHATFATFTSAGMVRRGLQAAGFKVEKVAGHGKKREMLRGEFAGGDLQPKGVANRNAIVIGGGMAGCASAYALANRGWQVTLIERHRTVAAEASGNHQGILYARLMPKMSPLSELTLAGYPHALRMLGHLLPQSDDTWRQCGLMQLAFDEREAARLQGILALGLPSSLLYGINREEASALAGVALPFGGLMFPGSGWVSPPALCRRLAEQPGITLLSGQEAVAIEHGNAGWQVHGESGVLATAPVVVVACANHTLRFTQTAHLPLRSIRGQVTHIPATTQSQAVNTVLCTEGYAAPVRHGIHTIGATYGNLEDTLELRAADHRENLDMLSRLSPEFYAAVGGDVLPLETLGGRAACRCNVVDYLPLLGVIASQPPGLYVNTGHGSRGLITAMLAGEALASTLEGEPAPLPVELRKAMSPSRFLSAKTL